MTALRRGWAVLTHAVRLTLRADRRTALLALVLVLAQAGVVAATALSQRWLVDRAIASDVAGVVAAVVLGALAHALSAAGGRVQWNMQIYLAWRVTVAITQEVIHTSAAMPTVAHLERPDYLDRLDRLRWGSDGIAWLPWRLLGTVAAVASLAISVGLLVGVNPLLAVLVLLALPPLLASRRSHSILRTAQDASAELRRREQRLQELCTQPDPARELFITGGGGELSRRADALWQAARRKETAARLRGLAWQGAGWLLYAAGFVAALLVVSRLIRQGQATLGDAVLVFSLATQLQNQIRLVAEELGRAAEGGHMTGHYWWLRTYARGQRRDGAPAPSRLTEGIVLDRVGFRYPGAPREALRGVDLQLPAGSTVALVGDNGAGKSTLVKLLTGVYEPSTGSIHVDGRPLSELGLTSWQERVSGVMQDFTRFQLRARETVGVGDVPRLHDEAAVQRAAVRAGADAVFARLPEGSRTPLGQAFGGHDPSPGQWQRLALARGLMRAAPLLMVLDEPTAALDPEAEYELFRRFAEQAGAVAGYGGITLLVSHRLTTVRMADLIVVLDGGRVVETGTHGQLLAAGGRYAEMFRLQQRAFAVDDGA